MLTARLRRRARSVERAASSACRPGGGGAARGKRWITQTLASRERTREARHAVVQERAGRTLGRCAARVAGRDRVGITSLSRTAGARRIEQRTRPWSGADPKPRRLTAPVRERHAAASADWTVASFAAATEAFTITSCPARGAEVSRHAVRRDRARLVEQRGATRRAERRDRSAGAARDVATFACSASIEHHITFTDRRTRCAACARPAARARYAAAAGAAALTLRATADADARLAALTKHAGSAVTTRLALATTGETGWSCDCRAVAELSFSAAQAGATRFARSAARATDTRSADRSRVENHAIIIERARDGAVLEGDFSVERSRGIFGRLRIRGRVDERVDVDEIGSVRRVDSERVDDRGVAGRVRFIGAAGRRERQPQHPRSAD